MVGGGGGGCGCGCNCCVQWVNVMSESNGLAVMGGCDGWVWWWVW